MIFNQSISGLSGNTFQSTPVILDEPNKDDTQVIISIDNYPLQQINRVRVTQQMKVEYMRLSNRSSVRVY